MTKINKKTRIKGLPAKLQLSKRDAVTGSYPTKIRAVSDNRRGNSPLRFDDTAVQPTLIQNVFYPSLLPVGSPNISTELTSSISANAVPRKGIEDQYISFTVSGAQNLKPFIDSGNHAADGKSNGNPFYATGSKFQDAGPGFDGPLWSKSKIEIDISTDFKSTIGYRSGALDGGLDFAMMYYNPNERKFTPVGSGKRVDIYQDDALAKTFIDFLDEKAIGFMPGMDSAVIDQDLSYVHQTPSSVFGFPYDKKYFIDKNNSLSSSILIPASNYIDKPFLLEKIVIEFSCSHYSRDYTPNLSSGGDRHAINTFFILNQKRSGKVNTSLILSGTSPVDVNLKLIRPATHTSGNVDIITFNQISFVNDTEANALADPFGNRTLQTHLSKGVTPIFTRDFIPADTHFTFTGSIVLSGTINSPAQSSLNNFSSLADLNFTFEDVPIPYGLATTDMVIIKNTGFVGGRNGIAIMPNSRNSKHTLEGITSKHIGGNIAGEQLIVPTIINTNPYLLLPSDQLVIGWQCSYPLSDWNNMFLGAPFFSSPVYLGPELTINPGPAKITLYGSQIKEGKEYHDTLNQETTSNAIHEVIG